MSEIIPKWLREVLNRGFKPKIIFYNFHDYVFGYVNAKSTIIKRVTKNYSLEGLPGSGKTSIKDYFKRDKKILTIDQILPAEPKFDQAMSQGFYFHSDELKTKKCSNSDKICLLDRYYPSTLAFYWAYDKIHKSNTYKTAWNWYRRALEDNRLIKPFLVFFIDTPIDLSLSRKNRIGSANTDNLWQNKKFLKYFNSYYKFFYTNIEPQTKLIKISGRAPLNFLINHVKSFLYEYE